MEEENPFIFDPTAIANKNRKEIQTTLLDYKQKQNPQSVQPSQISRRNTTPNRRVNIPNDEPEDFNYLLQAWDEYFQDDIQPKFNDQDFRHVLIREIYQNYVSGVIQSIFEWGSEKRYGVQDVYIDNRKLREISVQNISDICEILPEAPVDIISSFSLALDNIRVQYLKKSKKRIITRFHNFEQLIPLNDIKSNMIGHYIQVKGVVLRTTPAKLLAISMDFTCIECKCLIKKKFIDGLYQNPQKCETSNCKSKVFISDKNTAKTIFYQRIRIQEMDEDELQYINSNTNSTNNNQGGSRVPRTIDCELKETLVNTVISGDVIIVNGILKTEAANDNNDTRGTSNKNKVQGLFVSYIDINSLINLREKSQRGKQFMNDNDEAFSEQDLKIIEKLAENPKIFPLLIKSTCPAIYGHELVKAGLLLSIIGGSQIHTNTNSTNSTNSQTSKTSLRPDSHILLIGDPGIGKSQLLKFIVNIAPRAVYICGNAASNAGLTVTVQKDSATGESTLEAGALVLSDLGVCCIDEFDKMTSEHLALLEAMEQQTVSVAKSGVLCSLSTRCSIIASANPVGGHYNRSKSIKDNIKISNAILSRFDLIFLLLDHPDPKRDQKLSEHVMKLHQAKKRKREAFNNGDITYSQFHTNFIDGYYQYNNTGQSKQKVDYHQQYQQQQETLDQKAELFSQDPTLGRYKSLSEKLQIQCESISNHQILDPYLIRKYISYAKIFIKPTLSKEASEVLRQFYVSLRENSDSASSMPVTTRQLESLIRLSQARAKIELRNEVSKEDAMEIVELMQESLFDAIEDLNYTASTSKLVKGSKKIIDKSNIGILSVPKQTKLFIERLQLEAQEKESFIFEFQELLAVAREMNMQVGDFSEYIEKLNTQTYFLNKGQKTYELLQKRY